MIKAVAYCRYSSDNQRDASIDAQLRAIEEYCKNNDHILVERYIDKALSGTTDNRPEFLRMISDSAQNKFSVVLVHKFDRFSRDKFDSAFYKRELKYNNVRVISVLEPLDDSPESRILEAVIESFAQYYSENLSREVKKGQNENVAKGWWNGGTPPLGYIHNKETRKIRGA